MYKKYSLVTKLLSGNKSKSHLVSRKPWETSTKVVWLQNLRLETKVKVVLLENWGFVTSGGVGWVGERGILSFGSFINCSRNTEGWELGLVYF